MIASYSRGILMQKYLSSRLRGYTKLLMMAQSANEMLSSPSPFGRSITSLYIKIKEQEAM